MWKYSKKLMDHFMNPRNSGQLLNPDCHSEVGSVQCGDAMTLDIQVDDEDRIAEIRFMTFGCAGAIAASSAMTEIAKGKTLEEALTISNDQIVAFLGGMPEEKYHCSVMGQEALEVAIADFRYRRDNTAEHLDSILREIPASLETAMSEGSIDIEHIHPMRVTLRLTGVDEEAVVAVLEEELQKRTGKKVEVRVIR